MIKQIVVFALLMVGVLANAQEKNAMRKIGSFDKIVIANGIEATLVEGKSDSISIAVQDGEIEDVYQIIKGSTLELRLKTTRINKTKAHVTVSYQKLSSIEANSNSRVRVIKPIVGDKIELDANTGAIINLIVDCSVLKASASENSQIIVSGKCKSLFANATTGATFGGAGLASETAVVKASLKAFADFRTTQKAEIFSNTNAEVTLFGRTKEITTKTGLGGIIIEKDAPVIKNRPTSDNMIDTLIGGKR